MHFRIAQRDHRHLKMALLGILFLALLSPVASGEIYRWVDENGQVHFSDRVPPPVSKLERHVLDEQGNLRQVLQRQRTVEELEQHRLRLAAMATETEQREKQEKYDRYLLSHFKSVEELETLRAERMQERDEQLATARSDREKLEKRLADEQQKRTTNVIAQQNAIRNIEQELTFLEQHFEEVRFRQRSEFEGLSKDIQRFEYLQLRRSVYDR